MRTLVVSDLHLGSTTGADVLRDERVLARLIGALDGVDRLVLLGDVFEFRHGPVTAALAAAKPVLEAIGSGLGPDASIVLVPGNHDYELIRPWLDRRTRPLGVAQVVSPASASPLARHVAAMTGVPGRVRVAYPGIRLRDDVYAFHGHYLDVRTTVPTFERLAAGVMAKVVGFDAGAATAADDYERILAPMYAWIYASAQRARPDRPAAGAGSAGKVYEMLHGDGRRPIRARALLAALPVGLRTLSVLGLGPLSGDISGAGLLRGSLQSVGDVCASLGVDAEHVIFGHSHRIGPLRNDDLLSWRSSGGSWLYNCGSWVHEPAFTGAAAGPHPYWPGGAILLEEHGPPRPLRLLDGLELPGPDGAAATPARDRG